MCLDYLQLILTFIYLGIYKQLIIINLIYINNIILIINLLINYLCYK